MSNSATNASDGPGERVIRDLTKSEERRLWAFLVEQLRSRASGDVALAELVLDWVRDKRSFSFMIDKLSSVDLKHYPFYLTEPAHKIIHRVEFFLGGIFPPVLSRNVCHCWRDDGVCCCNGVPQRVAPTFGVSYDQSHGEYAVDGSPTYLVDQYVAILDTVGEIDRVNDDGTYRVDLYDFGVHDNVSRGEISFGLGHSLDKAKRRMELYSSGHLNSGAPQERKRPALSTGADGNAQPSARRKKRQKAALSAPLPSKASGDENAHGSESQRSPKGIADFEASFEPMETIEPMEPIDPNDPLWFFLGCGPSPPVKAAADALYEADPSTLSPLLKIAQDILRLVNDRSAQAGPFVVEANAKRLALLAAIEAVRGRKNWQGRGNVGDTISLRTLIAIVKHWAPPSECGHNDVNNKGSKIPRTNPCIRPWINSIARSMHKEGGGGNTWDSSIHSRFISDRLVFVDAIPIVPFSKENHQRDFETFAKDAGITMAQLHLLGFLLYVLHARAHSLHHGKGLTVAVATRAGWTALFHPHAPMSANEAIVLGMVAHGQCWAMRLPLMNLLVHPDEMIVEYSRILLQLYSVIAQAEGTTFMPDPPQVSFVAQRFGARMGVDLSPEERQARIEDIMAMYENRAAAWRAYWDKSMTEEQETYVLRMLEVLERGRETAGETNAFAWLAHLSGEASDKQRSIVERQLVGQEKGRTSAARQFKWLTA